MIDFQDVMSGSIVRAMRTCQGFAKRETTFRETRVEISTMSSDQDIARRLVAVREHFRLNQVEFAEKLHIAKNTLNGYEQATRSLTIETARRIHDRFGISTDWLLYGDIGQPSHDLVISLGPAPTIKKDTKKPKAGGKRRKAS
jgi:transcriptional regulator with XRE-family HTH domain